MTDNSSKSSEMEVTWEPDVARQIREGVASLKEQGSNRPFLVALAGIPGSGKSVSSSIVSSLLSGERKGVTDNDVGGGAISNVIMPMDGYHYSIEQLKTFDKPDDAIYRRGAPDTFDAKSLKRDLERIRGGNEEIIKIPGFDHAKGDPEEDAHTFVRSKHDVVICEGLYLLHNDDGWEEIADLFDLKVYISSDIDTCIDRLKVRNKCIPGYTPEEIEVRCDAVDRVNAHTVRRSSTRASVIVNSMTR
mmetsp:Transcript_34232/g.63312  ORF Transcript_34232/g.63312 Transcript_34232/m.63312 type:complete len:247 (-) Transcript_34232:248-988(-)